METYGWSCGVGCPTNLLIGQVDNKIKQVFVGVAILLADLSHDAFGHFISPQDFAYILLSAERFVLADSGRCGLMLWNRKILN